MKFKSEEHRRAVMASLNPGGRRHKRKSGLKVRFFRSPAFYDKMSERGEIRPGKAFIVYEEDSIYVNRDAVKGREDLRHTLLHEVGHARIGASELQAEGYALDRMSREFQVRDAREHEEFLRDEYRRLGGLSPDFEGLPVDEKEKVVKGRITRLLSSS